MPQKQRMVKVGESRDANTKYLSDRVVSALGQVRKTEIAKRHGLTITDGPSSSTGPGPLKFSLPCTRLFY